VASVYAGAASFRVDTAELEQLVADFHDGAVILRQAVLTVTQKRIRIAEREAVQKASGRLVDLAQGREIHRRTGRLAASISSRVEQEAAAVFARLGLLTGGDLLAYAAIQEFGGTVRPKRAKVLTIPLAAALTPAGVPRFTAREASEQYLTFWHKQQDGDLILYGYKGGGKNVKERQLVPLFLGVTQVTIKPAYFLTSSMNNAADAIQAELQANIAGQLLGQQRGGVRG